MDCLVSGMNGCSDSSALTSSSEPEGSVWVESDGWVVKNVDFGAGAVEGRRYELGSGGSRDGVLGEKEVSANVGADETASGAASCSDLSSFSSCSTSCREAFCGSGSTCCCLPAPS